MQVQPYLMFEGRCDEAAEFYRKALGAEITVLKRFKESPDTDMCSPGTLDKVMHMSFRIGDTTLLASDGRCTGEANFKAFRCRSRCRTIPRRSGCSLPWPRAGRCRWR
jgi:PhnB protein